MADFNEVKDSGKRQEFTTGSVRDTAEGKGTPHLIAGEALNKLLKQEKNILEYIQAELFSYTRLEVTRNTNETNLYNATSATISYIAQTENNTYSGVMKRLAKHYENGAKKYSSNNWRKGQPVSRYYDSAMRHLWALMDNKTDEDHASALLWNLIGIVQTKIDVERELLPKELDNFPFKIDEVFINKNKKTE